MKTTTAINAEQVREPSCKSARELPEHELASVSGGAIITNILNMRHQSVVSMATNLRQ
jgi:bacteriocin-like protein